MLLDINDAYEKLLKIATPITNKHYIPIQKALNHVLSNDIKCIKNLPSFDNAALDGYAFRYSEKENTLHVKTTIFAGDNQKECLGENECYKIMTGAKIPTDADCVVEFEKTQTVDESHVKISLPIKERNAFRFKGEELKKDELLLSKGTLLTTSHVMLLASQGITHVNVYKKPSVVVISTGDEIREPWESIDEESIYNSNTTGVISVLNRFGFEADYGGVVPDNLETSISFFGDLKKSYDVIISTGGVSAGEADFVLPALKSHDFSECFHGVKLRPGRPMLTGTLHETLVLSLPGNPMATFLCAYIFAVPAIKKKSGFKNPDNMKIKAKNITPFSYKKGRTNIILGTFENGTFKVTNNNKFGSGMITPIVQSNCYALSNPQSDGLQKDDEIVINFL